MFVELTLTLKELEKLAQLAAQVNDEQLAVKLWTELQRQIRIREEFHAEDFWDSVGPSSGVQEVAGEGSPPVPDERVEL